MLPRLLRAFGLAVLATLFSAAHSLAQQPCVPAVVGQDGKYLGNLSANSYDPNSVNNPYGQYGSPYAADSVKNPYGRYGSPYSLESSRNPYSTQPPKIVDPCTGKYLGRLSGNRYAPDSTSNPYGQYGSPHSADSINNPYGVYGSPYSSSSARNPFAFSPSTPLGSEFGSTSEPAPATQGLDWRIPLMAVSPPPQPSYLEPLTLARRNRAIQLDNERRARQIAIYESLLRSEQSRRATAPSFPPKPITEPVVSATALDASTTPPPSPAGSPAVYSGPRSSAPNPAVLGTTTKPDGVLAKAYSSTSAGHRPRLFQVEGMTTEQVTAFLGPPAFTQVRSRTTTVWNYATPDGVLAVFFNTGIASLREPRARTKPGVATRERTALALDACGAEIVAPNSFVTLDATPIFIRPQYQTEPLATFPAHAAVTVSGRIGGWFVAQFGDRRWGTRVGYVHCSSLSPSR